MRYTGIELIQVATSVLVMSLAVLLVALNRPAAVAASGPENLERSAHSIEGVIDARYDSHDDFLVITVADTTSVEVATLLGCRYVLPTITDTGWVTLFAVYTESGRILSSWIACE